MVREWGGNGQEEGETGSVCVKQEREGGGKTRMGETETERETEGSHVLFPRHAKS